MITEPCNLIEQNHIFVYNLKFGVLNFSKNTFVSYRNNLSFPLNFFQSNHSPSMP